MNEGTSTVTDPELVLLVKLLDFLGTRRLAMLSSAAGEKPTRRQLRPDGVRQKARAYSSRHAKSSST